MKIEVKQTHITYGCVTFTDCPIALALHDAFPAARISVRFTVAWINGVRHVLPQAAADFIARFDSGYADIQPFTFELEGV